MNTSKSIQEIADYCQCSFSVAQQLFNDKPIAAISLMLEEADLSEDDQLYLFSRVKMHIDEIKAVEQASQ